MFGKLAVLTLLATCHAGILVDDSHSHATSSQSVIRHDQPSHIQSLHQPQYSPLIQSHAPLFQQQPSIHQQLVHQPLIQQQHLVQQQLVHQPLVHQKLIQPVQQQLIHQTPVIEQKLVHQPLIQQQSHYLPLVQSHYQGPIQTLGLGHYATAAQTPVLHHAPIHAVPTKIVASAAHHNEEYYTPAKYEFSYSVADPHTGDQKSQHESSDGDVVRGEYSLVQPDGSVRKVEYTADDHSGFNAIVHQSSVHAAPAPAHHEHAAPAAPILAYHH